MGAQADAAVRVVEDEDAIIQNAAATITNMKKHIDKLTGELHNLNQSIKTDAMIYPSERSILRQSVSVDNANFEINDLQKKINQLHHDLIALRTSQGRKDVEHEG